MNITVIAVGKLKETYLKDALAEYLKRIGAYADVNVVELADEKAPETMSDKELVAVLDKEAERIMAKILQKAYVVTLEIGGKQFKSEEFAEFIDRRMCEGDSEIVFIIGGSNGLGSEVCKRSNFALSFSKMTFPHQLMRVMLAEQIYRAFRIINNHPYHK